MEASNLCTPIVLKKFDDALKCEVCHQTTKKPFTTGSCSHFFCQPCLLGLAETVCPKCSQPFYPGDITPDTTVGSILHEIDKIAKIFKRELFVSPEIAQAMKVLCRNKLETSKTIRQSIVQEIRPLVEQFTKSPLKSSCYKAPSNNLLNDVLLDIEHGESRADESNKIAERTNKKVSIYTKQQPSASVQNQISKPNVSATGCSKDVNENLPVFENNEVESVDMIGNSQSPIKKTPLCFAKQKPMRHALNDANKGRGNVSSKNMVRKNDVHSPYKSSDSDIEFDGFPKEVVYVKNPVPVVKDSKNTKLKSFRMERKPSLNGVDDGKKNIDGKANERRKIKRDWLNKMNENDEKLDESLVPIETKSDEKLKSGRLEGVKRKSSLNETDDAEKIDDNSNKHKKVDKKGTDNENSSNDYGVYIERKVTLKSANTNISKVKDNLNKSTNRIKVGKNYNKEPKSVSQFEDDSSEIIPATPQDSAPGKVVDPISARGKRQKQDGGGRGLNTSLNVNSTKRRDSVKRNKKGETPLQAACAKANLKEVERLINEGADPNTKDYAGWTPLHEAVLKGNVQIVEALVKAGANINTPGHLNISPLLEAVLQDNYIIVSFLLRNGADRSLKSRYNYRPMDCAQGEEMIKLLNQVHPLEGMISIINKKATTNFGMPAPFCLCPINLNAEQCQTLRDFCIKFDLKCVDSLRSEITHAIVVTEKCYVCKCDVNILKCLSNGIAVTSFNWIEHSLESNTLAKPDAWEVQGTDEFPNSKAFMKSRINAQKLLPKLFDGLHVSLTSYWPIWKDMKKNDIIDIVRDAGAVVLNREPDPESIPADERTVMFHANSDGPMGICSHITLYVPGVKEPLMKYNMKHLKTLSVKWITDCLQTFSIIDPL